ncbi:hemolysin III family protein [Psychromarinibacter sp. C21-152]|uniref:Hemolysin III family protein n=1 Tax=Psychromarinibacter sediminicola TaxID=3033385 RepID=A0AAE3NPJ5_9RHOB|nr:hemolysin III family protein [Psychromarinibacter sediminicola]MDF0599667.1 hemolysin III family protein [Psychromarinibacter sediminicola]
MSTDDPSPPAAIDDRPYSRPELISDAVVHFAALVLAVGAVPVLIVLTAIWRGDAPGIVGVTLYGVTLIGMLVASLAYNHLPRPEWREWLRRLDISAIYFKIAGTYTPFTLLSKAGWGMLSAIWSVAILATLGNLLIRWRSPVVGIVICLAMGWAVVLGGRDLMAQMSRPVLVLMLVGGGLYSLGTLFLLLERMRFHNTIWHVFVVAASTVFFVAVFLHAARTA